MHPGLGGITNAKLETQKYKQSISSLAKTQADIIKLRSQGKELRRMISEKELYVAEECFRMFGLPVRVNNLAAEDIVKISKSDKKMESGKIKYVLLKNVGDAYVDKTISDEELLKTCEYILQ